MRLLSIALLFATVVPALPAAAAPLEPLGLSLEGYEYPYPVEYLEIEMQRQTLTMAYMDVKPASPNGRTVLLLHGKNFCGAYWGTTIEALTKAGFRVVVPDQIGFGKSSKPDTLHYTFQLLARNTKAVLDHIGVMRTTVLGHSMGGMLATRFALMYPETTENLALVNPIGLEDWKLKVPYQPVEWWYERELGKSLENIREYQSKSYYHGTWKESYEPWAELLYRWTLSPDFRRLAWNNALTYDMIFTQPVVYEFPQVRARTLVMIGQLDRTALGKNLVSKEEAATMGRYPELGRATARAIPDAKLVELDGVGHAPHLEAFERFRDELLAFLDE
ncbi:MAG: alpha/beta fold hydrolase [Acidobacteria bacterium]|nr:alpha/beta fold hydrolase [Acidobacteriota bacterium]